jgi:aminoglycoside phosphotransferase (APT) family kinase protein
VANAMPPAEAEIDEGLVRRLLAEQHPDLADLPVEIIANGWDNVMCRLGDDLIARLPRRSLALRFLESEQRWLPELAPRLPLPVPVPVRTGKPGAGYPWSWSIVRYLPGQPAGRTPPDVPAGAARSLGGFLKVLHTQAPPDAPVNPVRGVPLEARNDAVAKNIDVLKKNNQIDCVRVQALWDAARATPRWDGPALWIHGDLHPANILVHDGKISAVIDFGDVTSGDPANDLSVAWMLFDDASDRDVFWQAYDPAVTAHTKQRAKGWALALSLVMMAHSADNPLMLAIGRRTHRTVLADRS